MINKIPLKVSMMSTATNILFVVFTVLMVAGLTIESCDVAKNIRNGAVSFQYFFSGTALCNVISGSMILMCVIMIINYFFTGRQFDRRFKVILLTNTLNRKTAYICKSLSGSNLPVLCSFSRSLIYSACIYRPGSTSNRYYPLFQGFDFCKHATNGAILSSYLIVYAVWTIIFVIIGYACITLGFYLVTTYPLPLHI